MTKNISISVGICLALTFSLIVPAAARPRVHLQQEAFTLSAEALDAAKRFSSNPKERKFADLEIISKELQTVTTTAGFIDVKYRPISRQQLIDLLGPPTHEPETGEVIYGHSFGTTAFYFSDDKLKNFLTLGESIYWYQPIRQSLAKRMWYKSVRWARKLKKFLF